MIAGVKLFPKKKTRKSFWLFVLGLCVFVFIVGLIVQRLSFVLDGNEQKVEIVKQLNDQSFDVLIQGNSIPHQGINPIILDSILGTSSFNLAIGGASFKTNELILRDYLKQNLSPLRVIYGISINRKEESAFIRPSIVTYLSLAQKKNYYQYLKIKGKKINFLQEMMNYVPLFCYRQVKTRAFQYFFKKDKIIPHFNKGQLEYNFVYKTKPNYLNHAAGIDSLGLVHYVTFCNENNIELHFIELPHETMFNETTTNRDEIMTQFLSVIKGKARFYSFNQGHNQFIPSPSEWTSHNHLNKDGANRFTLELSTYLKSI